MGMDLVKRKGATHFTGYGWKPLVVEFIAFCRQGVIQRFIERLIRVVRGDRAHLSNVMMVIELPEASNRQSCRCRYRDGGSHRLVGIVLKLYYMGESLAESLTIAFWCKSYGKCPLITGEQSYAKVVYTSNNLQSVYGRHRQPGGPSGTAGPSP